MLKKEKRNENRRALWCPEEAPGTEFAFRYKRSLPTLSPKMLHDDDVRSLPGTFHLVSFISKCFRGATQSWSVHVCVLVSSVASVWVKADFLSAGPCCPSVCLSLSLCGHAGLICLHELCLYMLRRLHSYGSFHSERPPTPLPLTACTHSPGSTGPLKETQRNASLNTSAVPPPHFLHDRSAPCLCQIDTVIITLQYMAQLVPVIRFFFCTSKVKLECFNAEQNWALAIRYTVS